MNLTLRIICVISLGLISVWVFLVNYYSLDSVPQDLSGSQTPAEFLRLSFSSGLEFVKILDLIYLVEEFF